MAMGENRNRGVCGNIIDERYMSLDMDVSSP